MLLAPPHALAYTAPAVRYQAWPAKSLLSPGTPRFSRTIPDISLGQYGLLSALYQDTLDARNILAPYARALGERALSLPATANPVLTRLTPSSLHPNLLFKREYSTAIGAYKIRGAFVSMAKMIKEGKNSFLAASTGNHALGVLKAAEILKPDSVTIYIPENTSAYKAEKIGARIKALNERGIAAELIKAGKTFDETREITLQAEEQGKGTFLHPYEGKNVVAGQGTIGLELMDQLRSAVRTRPITEVVVLAPVGGGGLLTGIASAMKAAAAVDPDFANINLKFVGLRLADVNGSKLGDAIRVADVSPANRQAFNALGVNVLEVTDAQIQKGLDRLATQMTKPVEGAAGATLYPTFAAEHANQYGPTVNRLVVCVLSGGNVTPAP